MELEPQKQADMLGLYQRINNVDLGVDWITPVDGMRGRLVVVLGNTTCIDQVRQRCGACEVYME